MSEMKINLKGWHAAIAIVVVLGLAGIRIMTFQDKSNDVNLMNDLERQIKSYYMPRETSRLLLATESGDMKEMAESAESLATTKAKIESVQISSPLLQFSTPMEVVVKVVYAMHEGTQSRDRETFYFLYHHDPIAKTWTWQRKTSATKYYLNFL
jgi:hypothetical protein